MNHKKLIIAAGIIIIGAAVTFIACKNHQRRGEEMSSKTMEQCDSTPLAKEPLKTLSKEEMEILERKRIDSLWRDTRVAVTLIYDKPVNGYKVTGKFYPFDTHSADGQVELQFVSVKTRDTLIFSNLDTYDSRYPSDMRKFSGKNLSDYVSRESFNGWKEGDTVVCHYYTAPHPNFNSPLFYHAEFQFVDVDFDGKKEFVVNDYSRGELGNRYVTYEIYKSKFFLKDDMPFIELNNATRFIKKTKTIEHKNEGDEIFFPFNLSEETKPLDSITIDPDKVTEEEIGSVLLYVDNGPYTRGDYVEVGLCLAYSYSETKNFGDVEIHSEYTYYYPLVQDSEEFTILFRDCRYGGKGYHGGHMVILKEECDPNYEYRSLLVRNKKDDIRARAFERYCRNLLRK